MISIGEPLHTKTDSGKKLSASPRDEPGLPAIDAELLYGRAMIARWLALTDGQATPLINDGTIPTFRMPGKSVRCALKSAINRAMQEYAARPGAGAKAPTRKLKMAK